MFFIYILVAPGKYLYLEHYKNYRCWTTNFDLRYKFSCRLDCQNVIDEYLDYDIDTSIGRIGTDGKCTRV